MDSIGFDDVTAKIDSLTEAQKNQVTVFMEQNAAGKSFGEQMNLLNTAIQSAEEYTGGLNATLSSMAGTITTATEAQALSNAEADNTTSKLGEEITAFNGLSESQQQLAIDISNSVLTMQQNLQSSVEQQMGLFDTWETCQGRRALKLMLASQYLQAHIHYQQMLYLLTQMRILVSFMITQII